jgi:hypothetical protein
MESLKMSKAETIIENTKAEILENIKDKLENISEPQEIYFHDIISSAIDGNTPTDRHTCLDLIDMANPEHFDTGLIDMSSLDRQLITQAYCSIEQNIFNDDFIQKLQEELNNETIPHIKARRLIEKIENYQEENNLGKVEHKDSAVQVYIKSKFKLFKEDFPEPYFSDKAVMEMGDGGIKILTSNKSINQNAIVIEKISAKKNFAYRIYLMEKDKDIDIRNFFKNLVRADYCLHPLAYIECDEQQNNEQLEREHFKTWVTDFESNKKALIFALNRMANKLTDISIKQMESKK